VPTKTSPEKLAKILAWTAANPEKTRTYKKRWDLNNRAKKLAYMRKWNAKNKAYLEEYRREWRKRNRHREKAYKDTRRQKDLAALDILAGRPRPLTCDICGGSHEGRQHNGIVFDHCHQHGHFRGWLCDRCNKVLGAIGDNTNLLRKMISYLERHRVNHARQGALSGI